MTASYASVQVANHDEKVHRRQLAEAINRHNNGKFNCALEVTLRASQTTTTISDARITAFSVLAFMPVTAHAAAAVANLYVLEATMQSGQAIINHASSANTDQSFRIGIFG